MYRYQVLIEYEGTNYKGWQIQKKGQTIQGVLQDKFSKLLKKKINIVGSGRTDAGVHALCQSAHFDCESIIINKDKFLKSINHFLKKKLMTVIKIKKRSQKFHARYSAKQRVYKYVIYNRVSPPVLNQVVELKELDDQHQIWLVLTFLVLDQFQLWLALLSSAAGYWSGVWARQLNQD